MTTPIKLSPRKKKLQQIRDGIARFAMRDCYTDEPQVVQRLAMAIDCLDKAMDLLKEEQRA